MNNILILVGKIYKDLELRMTTNGKQVLKLPLAIQNGKDDTTFVNIVVFGQMAELVDKYCKKGDLLGTQCILKNHNWEDEKGKHYEYQFIANKITFLQTKPKETKKEEAKEEVKEQDPFQEFANEVEVTGLDLPF